MVDVLITGGTVLTMDPERRVIDDGAVAIRGSEIADVGPAETIADDVDADRVVDATGHAILPGFINAHTHVPDVLLRSVGNDRSLFDWLYNIDIPGLAAMTTDEHTLAAALYCTEAIQAGTTTFVENAVARYDTTTLEAKLAVYEAAGMRNIYARGFRELQSENRDTVAAQLSFKEPSVEHIGTGGGDLDDALELIHSLIEDYHGSANGRQRVWPAPIVGRGVSQQGLARCVEIAEQYDVMATTHVSETALQERGVLSSVEYLNAAGYLGDRTLLGHCVHLDERDVRLLAATDTRVAHNPLSNLALGDGIAPIRTMLNYGVTVGLGTDNASASDTTNPLTDVRFAALLHKGYHEDAGAITAEKALEMATIDGARAIGRHADLGSIEPGKKADLVLLDLDHPHLTPHHNLPSAIVYQTQGLEVDTVICDGRIIMEDRRVLGLEADFPDLESRAADASRAVIDRAGLSHVADRPWTSRSSE